MATNQHGVRNELLVTFTDNTQETFKLVRTFFTEYVSA